MRLLVEKLKDPPSCRTVYCDRISREGLKETSQSPPSANCRGARHCFQSGSLFSPSLFLVFLPLTSGFLLASDSGSLPSSLS